MSLDNKETKLSLAKSLEVNFQSTEGINLEIVSLIAVSKPANCIDSLPIVEKKAVLEDCILFPSDKSLTDFLHYELITYDAETATTDDFNNIAINIKTLIAFVIHKNIKAYNLYLTG